MQEGIQLVTFKSFSSHSDIKHGITLRSGGCSTGNFATLNLSYNSGDLPSDVRRNRDLLAFHFGIEYNNLIFPEQCHTSNIVCIRSKSEVVQETDALVTDIRGIALAILAADCVPIIFFDKVKHVIAAAHAGWRGTVKSVATKVLAKMKEEYNSDSPNILIGIGPCIQQENYEVGDEVIQAIKNLGGLEFEQYILPSKKNGHAYVDLPGVNKLLLMQVGIPEKSIEVKQICTFQNPDMFFSARRDGFHTGRFASIIMLK
jgi:polyphenol oxidase